MRRLALLLVVFLALNGVSRSQLEARLTEANECRHVAILARDDFNLSYSARCFVPARVLEDQHSLRDIVPDEWRWVYAHNGTVSGQVIMRVAKADGSLRTVTIVTQKSCVDRGKAVGQPLRELYNEVGNNAEAIDEVGAFSTVTVPNDAHSDCVFNGTPWHRFRSLNGTPLPRGTKQYVRRHVGGHLGTGVHLIPFNFSYSPDQLDAAVRRALFRRPGTSSDVTTSPDECGEVPIRSGCPIVVSEYAHETGLSVLSQGSPDKGGLATDIRPDLSVLGWNRALQAKAALSGRLDPPLPEPEKLSRADLLSITVLAFVSAALYWAALKEARRTRRSSVQGWGEPVTRLTRVRSPSKPVPGARAGTLEALMALATAAVSIGAAILLFYDSDIRYQRIVAVNQGGVITYGKTKPSSSIDVDNQWAGAQFTVNHWLHLQVKEVGNPFLFPLVCLLYGLLVLVLLRITFKYSLWREHRLDNSAVRWLAIPARWLVGLLQTAYTRSFFHSWWPIASYESTFRSTCAKLSFMHRQTPVGNAERRWWQPLTRFDLDTFTPDTVQAGSHQTPRAGTPQEAETRASMHGMEELLAQLNASPSVTRNEIEKAAELLAADAFGMLNYAQALTLMYGSSLARVADRFALHGELPEPRHIKQLARIYYVNEVLMPAQQDDGTHPVLLEIADMRNVERPEPSRSIEEPMYTDTLRIYAPMLGFRPPPTTETGRMNDGVMYASYQADGG